ncbi:MULTISPECIES: hypothetical protein [Rhodococcus]|uniref:hypothetical protein n=1 Tax=Rhodococcus TaxID=1827 RepID=UPI000420A379|nr:MULTISPECIES: hypothetical protein [Rhodococcus]
MTNLPVELDRVTAMAFDVPLPTDSRTVVAGQRAAAALLMNRPEMVLRFTFPVIASAS